MHKVLTLKENISVNEGKVFQGFFLKEVKTVFFNNWRQASSDYIHNITVFTD